MNFLRWTGARLSGAPPTAVLPISLRPTVQYLSTIRQTAPREKPEGRRTFDRWDPVYKLSRQDMDKLRQQHQQDPNGTFSIPALSKMYRISPESVRRIVRSKFTPDAVTALKQEVKRKERRGVDVERDPVVQSMATEIRRELVEHRERVGPGNRNLDPLYSFMNQQRIVPKASAVQQERNSPLSDTSKKPTRLTRPRHVPKKPRSSNSSIAEQKAKKGREAWNEWI